MLSSCFHLSGSGSQCRGYHVTLHGCTQAVSQDYFFERLTIFQMFLIPCLSCMIQIFLLFCVISSLLYSMAVIMSAIQQVSLHHVNCLVSKAEMLMYSITVDQALLPVEPHFQGGLRFWLGLGFRVNIVVYGDGYRVLGL